MAIAPQADSGSLCLGRAPDPAHFLGAKAITRLSQ